MKTLKVQDPYRHKSTTLTEFAKAEGVPKHKVSHYFWYHDGTLKGFRERPIHGGRPPYTYKKDGKYISCSAAQNLVLGDAHSLVRWRKQGITDIDEIQRLESQRRKDAKNRFLKKTEDGRMVSLRQFAEEHGASYYSVISFYRRHGNSLAGFDQRGYSRTNQKKYPHSGLGISKTAKEWAEYYNVSRDFVRQWLWTHNKCMDGFETRKKLPRSTRGRTPLKIPFRGKQLTFKEIADNLKCEKIKVSGYYYNHGYTLDDFDPNREGGRRGKRGPHKNRKVRQTA